MYLQLEKAFLFKPKFYRTNFDLEKSGGLSSEEIKLKTGILKRPDIKNESIIDHCIQMLSDQNLPSQIDVCIFTTSTPDQFIPSHANTVLARLGIKAKLCFDLNSACSGYLHALKLVFSLLSSDQSLETALIISSDKGCSLTDPSEAKEDLIFSDGIAATLHRKSLDSGWKIIAENHSSFPADSDLIRVPSGAFANNPARIQLNGALVYARAVKSIQESIEQVLRNAEISIDMINYIIPHQGNDNITKRIIKNLGIDEQKVYRGIQIWGNSISATVPTGIAIDNEKISAPGHIILTAYGAGTNVSTFLIEVK